MTVSIVVKDERWFREVWKLEYGKYWFEERMSMIPTEWLVWLTSDQQYEEVGDDVVRSRSLTASSVLVDCRTIGNGDNVRNEEE